MAKFLPLLLFFSQVLIARGADNLLEVVKGPCGVEDIKRQLDVTRPQDINTLADEEGRTSLFFCRHLGTTLLLLAGADPNVRDNTGRTPAFRAVSRSRDVAFPIMLELLALAHTDVNARDKDGITLLAWAAQEDNLSAVKLLLLLGADPAPNDVPGDKTPLFFALRQDDKMADLLRNAANAIAGNPDGKIPVGIPANEKLVLAARAARLAAVSDALIAGADINARDKDGATALFRAVAERRANVAALLLLNGADPNLAKNDGKTPLMECVNGFDMAAEGMLVELLVAGANVNATAKDGTTALSQSVRARNNTAAQWMIWRGASLDVHSPDGTLMQAAMLHPDWPSMITLLERAGVPAAQAALDKQKDPALFDAVRSGDLKAVEAELQRGTPVDITNHFDQTALEWAVCYDHFDIVDVLLHHGADINHQHSYNGEHIIHNLAGRKGVPGVQAAELIKQLVQRGANPNLVMHDGATPLMVAARDGVTTPNMDVLLKLTTDINARDKQGMTALSLARQHGHAAVARSLQDKGALE